MAQAEGFRDKVIVITGASEGIGRALTLALAPAKAKLVIAARNEERLASLKDEAEALGSEVLVIRTDVMSEDACRALIEQTVSHRGRLDILVNNAGGTMWAPVEALKDTDIFRYMIHVNYLSCVFCTYYSLEYLRSSQGLIVGIASLAGLTGVPCRSAYAASKHAMIGFLDSLRVELRGSGVDVTIVAPDFVKSQIHRRAIGADGNPLGETPMQEDKIMTAEACADQILQAMAKRKRLHIPSFRGKFLPLLKIVLPSVLDRMTAKAIREKR